MLAALALAGSSSEQAASTLPNKLYAANLAADSAATIPPTATATVAVRNCDTFANRDATGRTGLRRGALAPQTASSSTR